MVNFPFIRFFAYDSYYYPKYCDLLYHYLATDYEKSLFKIDNYSVYIIFTTSVILSVSVILITYYCSTRILYLLYSNNKNIKFRMNSNNNLNVENLDKYLDDVLSKNIYNDFSIVSNCSFGHFHVCPYSPTVEHPDHYRDCFHFNNKKFVLLHNPNINFDYESLNNRVTVIDLDYKCECVTNAFDMMWNGGAINYPTSPIITGTNYSYNVLKQQNTIKLFPTLSIQRKNVFFVKSYEYTSFTAYKFSQNTIITDMHRHSRIPNTIIDETCRTMSNLKRDPKFDEMVRSYAVGRLKSKGLECNMLGQLLEHITHITDLVTLRVQNSHSKINEPTYINPIARYLIKNNIKPLKFLIRKIVNSSFSPWNWNVVPVPSYEMFVKSDNVIFKSTKPIKTISKFRTETTSSNSGCLDGGQSHSSQNDEQCHKKFRNKSSKKSSTHASTVLTKLSQNKHSSVVHKETSDSNIDDAFIESDNESASVSSENSTTSSKTFISEGYDNIQFNCKINESNEIVISTFRNGNRRDFTQTPKNLQQYIIKNFTNEQLLQISTDYEEIINSITNECSEYHFINDFIKLMRTESECSNSSFKHIICSTCGIYGSTHDVTISRFPHTIKIGRMVVSIPNKTASSISGRERKSG